LVTCTALAERYNKEVPPGNSCTNSDYPCDVIATPEPTTGLDPDGHAAAVAKFVDPGQGGCEFRLVALPILHHFPTGASEDIVVLGVATYGIVKWDRQGPWGDPIGTAAKECGEAGPAGFNCGMVWGFLIKDAVPPDFLLEQITETGNDLSPILRAMIE
jgi:hypothetical protein